VATGPCWIRTNIDHVKSAKLGECNERCLNIRDGTILLQL